MRDGQEIRESEVEILRLHGLISATGSSQLPDLGSVPAADYGLGPPLPPTRSTTGLLVPNSDSLVSVEIQESHFL